MIGYFVTMVSEKSIHGNTTKGYTKLELILKESDQKMKKYLSRIEGKLDTALTEIKALINGMALQFNEIKS